MTDIVRVWINHAKALTKKARREFAFTGKLNARDVERIALCKKTAKKLESTQRS